MAGPVCAGANGHGMPNCLVPVFTSCQDILIEDSPHFNMSRLSAMCPGIDYFSGQNDTTIAIKYANKSDCCYTAMVPRGSYINVELQRLEYWCSGRQWETHIMGKTYKLRCDLHSLDELFFQSANYFVGVRHLNRPSVRVMFYEIKQIGFIKKQFLHYSGYMIAPILMTSALLKIEINGKHDQAVMISFPRSYLSDVEECIETKSLTLIYQRANETDDFSVQSMLPTYFTPAIIVFASSLEIQMHTEYYYFAYAVLYFSLHWESDLPRKLPSGSFNCSVSSYAVFQVHVHCNFKPECQDGEDETEHCPFSSPQCKGLVASRNKCFTLIRFEARTLITVGSFSCFSLGGRLASLKTRKEQNDSLHLIKNINYIAAGYGYFSGWFNVHFVYSKFPRWSDNTVIYTYTFRDKYSPWRFRQAGIWPSSTRVRKLHEACFTTLVCEIPALVPKFSKQSVFLHSRLLNSVFINTKQFLLVYTKNELSHSFLFSNFRRYEKPKILLPPSFSVNVSNWQNTVTIVQKETVADREVMFACDDDITTVSYTLVCDLHQDCSDNSDESFCQRSSCHGFFCSNSQCVLHSQRCNEHADCRDDSDETGCDEKTIFHFPMTCQGRSYIDLDGSGYFTYQIMTSRESCPDTHYSCTAEYLYCLPVYTKCNGYNDCLYGEDEQNCETNGCPYYYRCKGSKACVHEDHLCDGWGQCPQRDDELLCDTTCPEACLCQGYSFWCRSPIPLDIFPAMRFIDATGSGMSLAAFAENDYLVFLRLSACSLSNVSNVKLPNLQFLDLSHNNVEFLNFGHFMELLNLRTLSLANNPVRTLTHHLHKPVHYTLTRLDMSITILRIAIGYMYLYLPSLTYLNVSSSAIQCIGSKGFKHMPVLTKLDVRWNPLNDFPSDLFSRSPLLHRMFSPDYRLCCDIFTKAIRNVKCEAVVTVFPSCQSLFPSELHSVLFWVIAVTSVAGSLACCLASVRVQKLFENQFVTTLSHLHVADVCMGIHVAVVIAANEVFYGQYVQLEKLWTRSVACKMSSFLFILSNEVSVLIILIITLDHVLLLYNCKNSRIFQRSSIQMKSAVSWVIGICLSAIPFLPGLSHWGLSDQSGLCRMALFQGFQPHVKFRWFHVIAVINFIVCLIITVGQVMSFKLTPTHRITLDPAHRSVYSAVHVMRPVAVLEVLCWWSYGVVTMIIAGGTCELDTLHGTLVVFMLPFNSALNPVLYMWTALTQKRAKDREERMLAKCKLKVDSQKVKSLNK